MAPEFRTDDVYLYYWDGRDGDGWSGWWATPDKIGANAFYLHSQTPNAASPAECPAGSWKSKTHGMLKAAFQVQGRGYQMVGADASTRIGNAKPLAFGPLCFERCGENHGKPAYKAVTSSGMSHDQLRAAFSLFDADNSGTLTRDELKAILCRSIGGMAPLFSEKAVDQLVAKFDANGDGVLSMDEFARAWSKDAGAGKGVGVIEAAAHLSVGVDESSPLDHLMTHDEIIAALPPEAQQKERSGFPWLLLKCEKEAPQLLPHHRKLLGLWNADKFPRPAHKMLRDLTAGLKWGFFVNKRSWHQHFLLHSPELEARFASLLDRQTDANAAMLRLLIGLCVADNGNEKTWPPWLVAYFQPHGQRLLQQLNAPLSGADAAADLASWPSPPPQIRLYALPGRAAVATRNISLRGVKEQPAAFYERHGLPRGQSVDSTAVTNHARASELVAGSSEGGDFDCTLSPDFPHGSGGTVCCGAQQIVYSDALATAAVVKEFADEALAAAVRGSGFELTTAPVKDALRLIAKGKEYWEERRGGMVDAKDCVRYKLTLPTMARAAEAIALLEKALGSSGRKIEVANKMNSDFKAVFLILGISLAAAAKRHPFFKGRAIPPEHLFPVEVQLTTAKYGLLNKYSHTVYELAREAAPGRGYLDLSKVLKPLGMQSTWD